ncbi:MAG: hypothetical protein WKF89_07635 [Chitinophagaceae bacterium]
MLLTDNDRSCRSQCYYASRAEEAPELWKDGIDFILVNNLPLFLPEMKKYGIIPVKNIF